MVIKVVASELNKPFSIINTDINISLCSTLCSILHLTDRSETCTKILLLGLRKSVQLWSTSIDKWFLISI